MKHRAWLSGSLLTLMITAGYACGSGVGNTGGNPSSGSGTGTSSSGGGSSSGTGGHGVGGDIFMNHGKAVSLAINPPMGTIDVVNGAPASASFEAIATFEDSFVGPVAADWTWDKPELALVNSMGTLTAQGNRAGTGTLKATFGVLEATAPVSIKLSFIENPAGLTPADQALFDAPDNTPSGTLLYPYDKTVFARGLLAPDMMWSGGAAGDAYKVHIQQNLVDAVFYVNADPPSSFKMTEAFWTALTQSNQGDDVIVDIQRLSAGVAHLAMHETWTIAQGNLRGSIYYWAVNTGQLMKVAPGASSPSVVFDSGPFDQLGSPAPAAYNNTMPPWESGGNGKRCVACHSVSKDGSTIAAVFEKKGSTASPWGTIDLTQNPASVVQITPYNSTTIYLGLSPDGAFAVQNDLNMTMRLANAKTGVILPSALDGFADKTADPAFSHDSKLLAFSSFVNGFYPVEFYRADLDVVDFDPATTAFTNRRTVVQGGNLAVAFPSFSPDSAWILYQYGDYSRARYGANGDVSGNDDLYITDVAAMMGPEHLAAASGATLEPRNQHKSYQPTVNPIAVGGYMWVVFVSPRDYGNKMLSTVDPTTQNRKQLWVAAVNLNPQPGEDPSHPAFWLPGQDLSTVNMSGYWALEPCHQEGVACNEGYECCTGFCQPDGMGGYACVPPPGGCSKLGEACVTDGDCCDAPAAKCIGGFCAQSQPN